MAFLSRRKFYLILGVALCLTGRVTYAEDVVLPSLFPELALNNQDPLSTDTPEESINKFLNSAKDDAPKPSDIDKPEESTYPLPDQIQVQGADSNVPPPPPPLNPDGSFAYEIIPDNNTGEPVIVEPGTIREEAIIELPLTDNEVKVNDIPPPPTMLPDNMVKQQEERRLEKLAEDGYQSLHQHMQAFIESLKSKGMVADIARTDNKQDQSPKGDDLDDLFDLNFDEPAAPSDFPPVVGGPEQEVAGNQEQNSVVEEEKSPELIEALVKNEIMSRNPLLTSEQVYAYTGDCMRFPEELTHCRSFACTKPETKDSENTIEYKVKGEEDGKCYMGSSLTVDNSLYMDCIFADKPSRQDFANGWLEFFYSGGVVDLKRGDSDNAALKAYDVVFSEQCKMLHEGQMMLVKDIRAITKLAEAPTELASDSTVAKDITQDAQEDGAIDISDINLDDMEMTPEEEQQLADMEEADAEAGKTMDEMEAESQPVTSKKKAAPKITEADKAYFDLLEEKRKSLPRNKQLSNETRETMKDITTVLSEEPRGKKQQDTEYISVSREGKKESDDDEFLGEGEEEKTKMDVSVRSNNNNLNPANVQEMLETAYKALLAGQVAAATNIYKTILDRQHDNKDALFGLATAYHRNSQFNQARAIYTEILQIDPNHKEALNNFLVLAAEEAPENALIELEKLERINPKFSPVPAQIAMIYLKMGKPKKAERYLKRAVVLSPDNTVYKYNLAITSDRLGKKDQAIHFYEELVSEVSKGAIIPGSISDIKKRLFFLQKKVN